MSDVDIEFKAWFRDTFPAAETGSETVKGEAQPADAQEEVV